MPQSRRCIPRILKARRSDDVLDITITGLLYLVPLSGQSQHQHRVLNFIFLRRAQSQNPETDTPTHLRRLRHPSERGRAHDVEALRDLNHSALHVLRSYRTGFGSAHVQFAVCCEKHVGRAGGVGLGEVEGVGVLLLLDGEEALLVAVDCGEPAAERTAVEGED